MRRIIIALLVVCCLPIRATASAPPAPRLVVLGDSIGVGLGASAPDRSYARLVAAALGLPLDNRAISGTTIAQQPVPDDLTPADTVIWLTGYNDMRAGNDPVAYGAALRAAVAQMVSQGATVYLAGCLPLADYATYAPDWDRGSAALVTSYTAQIESVPGARFVRIAYDARNVAADQVHPNDAGHAQIANSLLAVMRRRIYLPAVL